MSFLYNDGKVLGGAQLTDCTGSFLQLHQMVVNALHYFFHNPLAWLLIPLPSRGCLLLYYILSPFLPRAWFLLTPPYLFDRLFQFFHMVICYTALPPHYIYSAILLHLVA
jgi:hypothetical protein